MKNRHRFLRIMAAVFCLALPLTLAGCAAPVLIGAGAVAVAAGSTEKGFGTTVNDSIIKSKIKELQYRQDVEIFRRVDVTVNQGSVVLTGMVTDPVHKVEAARLAWQVKGVHEVIEELAVTDESSLKNVARDRATQGRLRFKLIGDPEISSLNFSSDVVNGTVYLMGVAESEQEMQAVVTHAREVAGDNEVVNYIRVSDDQRK